MEQRRVTQISRAGMTHVMQNTSKADMPVSEDGDILLSDVTGAELPAGGSCVPSAGTFPMIVPENPTFTVPSNPLLPEQYSEILDYNSLQYLNGIYRTQIGRYVRVQQLVGSNTLEDYDGFLIGVGINYIILQEYTNENIRILDIYGIKSMYVYYTALANPYRTAPSM